MPLLAKVPSVLVVEDAEPLLGMERTEGTSVLLNLTDGLLNDVARTQVICTFNAEIEKIYPALLRHGRLLARWEFAALSVEDARRVAAELGIDGASIDHPVTIAEIAAFRPLRQVAARKAAVGFG